MRFASETDDRSSPSITILPLVGLKSPPSRCSSVLFPDPDAHGDRWIQVLTELEQLQPDVVVPGHGDLGGVEILTATREYLQTVRAQVTDAVAHDSELAEAQQQLNPRIRDEWADWKDPIWIDGAIARFYEEAKLQSVVS